MAKDIVLPTAVTVIHPDAAPLVIRTVQHAIEWIHSLPERDRQKPHWRHAMNDLLDAREVRDVAYLNKARWSFAHAVREEYWL